MILGRSSTHRLAVLSPFVSFLLIAPVLTRLVEGGLAVFLCIASLAVVTLAGWVWYVEGRKSTNLMWLSPFVLFTGIAFFNFGISSFAWVWAEPSSTVFTQYDVALALVFVVLATWALLIGFFSLHIRLRPIAWNRFNGLAERFPGASAAAFLVGIGGFAGLFLVDQFLYLSDSSASLAEPSSVAQLLRYLVAGTIVGAAIATGRGVHEARIRQVVVGLGMFAIVGMIGIVGAQKETVIVAGFGALASAAVGGYKPNRWLLMAIGLSVMITFVGVSTYRTGLRYESLTPANAGEQTVALLVQSANDPLGLVGQSVGTITARNRFVDSVAAVIARSPGEIPYRDWAQWPLDALSVMTPRLLWPEKPYVADGYDFAVEYFNQPRSIISSMAITPYGGLLRYGGLLVLIAGSVGLGGYLALLDRAVDVQNSRTAILPLLVVALPFAQGENSAVVLLVEQVRLWLVVLAFMAVVLAPAVSRSVPRVSGRSPG